jgi:hypothetical protein
MGMKMMNLSGVVGRVPFIGIMAEQLSLAHLKKFAVGTR